MRETINMNAKTSLFLSILFLIIASFAFMEMIYWQPKREKKSISAQTVVELEGQQFEWLELGYKGRNTIRLLCAEKEACDFSKENKWRIVIPIVAEADSRNVAAMLAHLKRLDFIQEIVPPSKLKKRSDWRKEFGLDAPEAWIKIKIKQRKYPIRIELGGKTPVGSHFYVTNNHKPGRIFLLRNYFIRVISPKLLHWRDKRLFPGIDKEQIKKFQWKYHTFSKQTEVEKKENKVWWLSSPYNTPAKQELIEGMLSLIVKANLISILTNEEAKKIQTKQKSLRIKFSTEMNTPKAKEYQLDFWALPKAKEYLIRSSEQDWFATVRQDAYESFTKKYSTYIQGSFFPPSLKKEAHRMEWFFTNGASLALQKDTSGWKLEKNPSLKLNQAFYHFWENAFSPNILRSASPKEALILQVKKKNKAIRVAIYGKNKKSLYKYKIWLPKKREILIQREGSSLYYLVGEKVAMYIPSSPERWTEVHKKK